MSLRLIGSCDELRAEFLALRSAEDVARLLDIPYQTLIWHIYRSPIDKRYTTFEVTKRSGGVRTISAPATALKVIQQKLNQVLQCVYKTKPPVHGFARGRSIVSNAKVHRRKRYVLNIDLVDFFPSINFGRVRGMFMAVPYQLNDKVATVLAQICCHEGELPQGAPTSPVISNMLCAKLDSQLLRLAQKHRCYYTRYADDLTFSTSLPLFPRELAVYRSTYDVRVGKELQRIVRDNGFDINKDKVRLQQSYRRQEVTGLTVNEKVNVQRKLVRQVRAMLYAWETHGLHSAERDHLRKRRKTRNPASGDPSFRNVVKGKLMFIRMVKGKDDPVFKKLNGWFKRLDSIHSY